MSLGWALTSDMDGFAYILFIPDNEKWNIQNYCDGVRQVVLLENIK